MQKILLQGNIIGKEMLWEKCLVVHKNRDHKVRYKVVKELVQEKEDQLVL